MNTAMMHQRASILNTHSSSPHALPPRPTLLRQCVRPSCAIAAAASRKANQVVVAAHTQPQNDTQPSSTHTTTQQQPATHNAQPEQSSSPVSHHNAFLLSFSLFLLAQAPAAQAAFEPVSPFQGVYAPGQYVTLGLFLMTVPGIWSQIKRAPKASKKRKVYEVDGPGKPDAISLKDRARQIVAYFKKYNYETKEMGEVITFVGTYGASRGQAAAVTFYTFIGMACVGLVMSVLVPSVGGWWYSLTLLAPGAWLYYMDKGTRQEEVKVKMATADDEMTTDIAIEGDPEEIDRFRKELGLIEKGMVPVKGLLE